MHVVVWWSKLDPNTCMGAIVLRVRVQRLCKNIHNLTAVYNVITCHYIM